MMRGDLITIAVQGGLQKTSQIMIDKTLTVRKEKLGRTQGHIDRETLTEVERCLAVFLGIAKKGPAFRSHRPQFFGRGPRPGRSC
jgi:hypothetical protein